MRSIKVKIKLTTYICPFRNDLKSCVFNSCLKMYKDSAVRHSIDREFHINVQRLKKKLSVRLFTDLETL